MITYECLRKVLREAKMDGVIESHLEPFTRRVRVSLRWMLATIDFQNQQAGAVDKEDSPEVKEARVLLKELTGV